MKHHISYLVVALTFAFVAGCSSDSDGSRGPQETAIAGTAEILCDKEVYDLMQTSKRLYDKMHPDADVTLTPVSAQELAGELLSHDARGVVMARDWNAAEDSVVMKQKGEEGYPRTLIARDALVFLRRPRFPT